MVALPIVVSGPLRLFDRRVPVARMTGSPQRTRDKESGGDSSSPQSRVDWENYSRLVDIDVDRFLPRKYTAEIQHTNNQHDNNQSCQRPNSSTSSTRIFAHDDPSFGALPLWEALVVTTTKRLAIRGPKEVRRAS